MIKAYKIRNWDRDFENHESRKVRSLAWVPVRNKHDGRGYRRVVALPNSVQVFCAFILIVEVASKMPTRGVLLDDDGALTASDLAAKTGFPEAIFDSAFKALTAHNIRWIEEAYFAPVPGDAGNFREMPGETALEGKGTESLSIAREGPGEDPNLWPMRPAVSVNPPIDPVWNLRWEALHSWYEQQMGSKLRLDMALERLWFEWFKAGFDEDQFKRVFKYLRGQIKERKRNDGALKLSNLLLPDRFGADLALASINGRPIAEKKSIAITAPDPKPTPEQMEEGRRQIAKLKEAVRV
jgi:hypothetical protein